MKLGIIIYSNDPETVWNAFRFAAFSLKQGDETRVFLTGKGVEAEHLDTGQFKVTEMIQGYVDAGGQVGACGTCLKLRVRDASPLCPLSNMKTMHEIIQSSDRVVTF
jgi:uncharacterized protein involved in oxidation of intracellular sulfur